ncbi:MAG: aspartyl/glutamyl-tRNA amidotransferase subunit C [Treponema sp.]|nr:aspartyl/glutamyl-tRNA amidotransferase subunit C [Treponema sp.]
MELTDLKETAELARLNLGDNELKTIFPAFEEMASFFAVMQDADADNALPAAAGITGGMAASSKPAGAGYLRLDAADGEEDGSESLLSQAPERDGRFVVIPNVL